MRPKTYVLEDGEAMHANNPQTFWMPDRADRESLQPGDLVKLIFSAVDDDRTPAERAWVEVVSRKGKGFMGRVDNDLLVIDTGNGMVLFGPQHVIQIMTSIECERMRRVNQSSGKSIH